MADKKTDRLVFSVGTQAHDGSPTAIKHRVLKAVRLPARLDSVAEDGGGLAPDVEEDAGYRPEDGMVFVPAGPFVMGDNDGAGDEQPQRQVHQAAFWIDTFPVTNRDYKAFVDASGHRRPPHWVTGIYALETERHPVTNVSYKDAQAYAQWKGKRLPTEAEWEKAARGPRGQTYAWGDAFRKDHVNSSNEYGGPTPVDQFPGGASPYGVFDVCGNCMEWCQDWYYDAYYASGPSEDPQGPPGGEYRCLRGGFFGGNKSDVRATARHWAPPANMQDHIGFRCAKTPLRPGETPPQAETPEPEAQQPREDRKMAPITEDQSLSEIAASHPESVAKVIRAGLNTDTAHKSDAAILLISLGRAGAVEVMKYLTDKEIEVVARDMADRQVVTQEERDRVQGDFKARILSGTHLDYGGIEFTADVLQAAMGPRKARAMVDRCVPRSTSVGPLERLDPTVIATFLSKEHTQTIALILTQVDSAKAMSTLKMLPEEIQAEVLTRIGSLGTVRAQTLRNLEEALEKELRNMSTGQVEVGGPRAVVEVLQHAGAERDAWIEKLKGEDAELGEAVESQEKEEPRRNPEEHG